MLVQFPLAPLATCISTGASTPPSPECTMASCQPPPPPRPLEHFDFSSRHAAILSKETVHHKPLHACACILHCQDMWCLAIPLPVVPLLSDATSHLACGFGVLMMRDTVLAAIQQTLLLHSRFDHLQLSAIHEQWMPHKEHTLQTPDMDARETLQLLLGQALHAVGLSFCVVQPHAHFCGQGSGDLGCHSERSRQKGNKGLHAPHFGQLQRFAKKKTDEGNTTRRKCGASSLIPDLFQLV